jgi:hypothetical protein
LTTTAVMLRTSERATFRRCLQKWEWSYLRGLEPVRFRGALSFGSMVHAALAAWYVPGRKRGQHPAEVFLELYDAQPEDFEQWDEDGEKIDARELGWSMLSTYVDHYGTDDDWEMVQPEMTFQIDVYDRQDNYLCTYVGTFDGVAINRKTGRKFLPEHKTAKSVKLVQVNSGYGEQGLSYWWAANMWLRHTGVLKEKELIESVFFNFLRKAMPDERPVNADGHRLNKPNKDALLEACASHDLYLPGKPKVEDLWNALVQNGIDPTQYGEVSKTQPQPFFVRQELIFGHNMLERFNTRLRGEAWHMAQIRAGKAPVYKNPTQDCSWDCPFYAACEVHEMGGDYEGIIQLDFKPWDPYSDHNLQEERT